MMDNKEPSTSNEIKGDLSVAEGSNTDTMPILEQLTPGRFTACYSASSKKSAGQQTKKSNYTDDLEAHIPASITIINANKNKDTMTTYEVIKQPLNPERLTLYYRARYTRETENDEGSVWRCCKLQYLSSDACAAALFVKMEQNLIAIRHIGRHKCRNPSLSTQKWFMEEPNRSDPVVKGTTAAPKTVKDINIHQNITHQNLYLVYRGRGLDEMESAMREDNSIIQKLCNQVEIIYVSGVVYDFGFCSASSVLCHTDNSELVYYSGKTYRKYSSPCTEVNLTLYTQYRCNDSVDCLAELRLNNAFGTTYALRFEHHTCLDIGMSKPENDNNIVKRDLSQFYSTVNSKCVEPASKPFVYFRGYLYEYLHHMGHYHANNDADVQYLQHKYGCVHAAVNCSAHLIFCLISGYRHIIRIGNHSCRCGSEEDEDYGNRDIEDLINSAVDAQSEIKNISVLDGIDCKEEVGKCDIKELLECSVELNQEVNLLSVGVDKNNDASGISDFASNSSKNQAARNSKNTKGICNARILKKFRSKEQNIEAQISKKINLKTNDKNDEPRIDERPSNFEEAPKKVLITCPLISFAADPRTNPQIKSSHNPTVVIKKNLGYNIGDLPKIDPNDSSTVYLYCNIYHNRASQKKAYYMGYKYAKVLHSHFRYDCDASLECLAWLNLKSNLIIVCGPHTCRNIDKSVVESNTISISTSMKSKEEAIPRSPTVDVNSLGLGEEYGKVDLPDADDQMNDATLSKLKEEVDIDITEHRVAENEIKIEEKSDIATDNNEVCFVAEVSSDETRIQAFIDITLDDSDEELINNGQDMENNEQADAVSDVDKTLVAYRGYEYHKEESGKFAWCKWTKICSGMIKILPDGQGELVGRHSCDNSNDRKGPAHKVMDNEKTVHVEIRKISNTSPEMHLVPVIEQNNYYKSPSGLGIQFGSNQFVRCWENVDVVTFICVHKNTSGCPGMLEMLDDKVVRYSDHMCNSPENMTLPKTGSRIVLMYHNKLTSNSEIIYKGFTYGRTSRTSHLTMWQCTEANCTAVVKIYTITSTLSECGTHRCTSQSVKWISEKPSVLAIKKENEKAYTKNDFPTYQNKSIIPVYNDEGEFNLIYQGHIYRGEGDNWECIYLGSKGCKGLLRLCNRYVMAVFKHDCFQYDNIPCSSSSATSLENKYSTYTDFLHNIPSTMRNTRERATPGEDRTKNLHLFRGSLRKEFALYEGYVYKKMFKKATVYKWICTSHLRRCCEGVLTTKHYVVLAVSKHICRDKDFQNTDESRVANDMKRELATSADGLNDAAVPSKKLKRYPQSKKRKSTGTPDDMETQIPAIIDQVEGNDTRNHVNRQDPMEPGESIQYNEDDETIALTCEENACNIDISTMKEEHLELDVETDVAIATGKEEELAEESDIEDENVSLTRGPNGEYFVYFKDMADHANNPNAL